MEARANRVCEKLKVSAERRYCPVPCWLTHGKNPSIYRSIWEDSYSNPRILRTPNNLFPLHLIIIYLFSAMFYSIPCEFVVQFLLNLLPHIIVIWFYWNCCIFIWILFIINVDINGWNLDIEYITYGLLYLFLVYITLNFWYICR